MTAPLLVSRSLPVRDRIASAIVDALADDRSLVALQELARSGQWAPDEVATNTRRLAAGVAVAEACRRELESDATSLARALGESALLFGAGLYFEVHEVLEARWLGLDEPERSFVQGLIQIAVALHHLAHENPRGASSLLAAGRAKIAPHVPTFAAVRVDVLLDGLVPWEAAAAAGAWPRDLPVPRLVVAR